MEPQVTELLDRLKTLRAEGPDAYWCEHGVTLVEKPSVDTMAEWYNLNRRFPQYWLHVFSLCNPDGAKAMFLDSVRDLFPTPASEAMIRHHTLRAATPRKVIDEQEAYAMDNYKTLPSDDHGALRTQSILLVRTCQWLRNLHTLAPVWAGESLMVTYERATLDQPPRSIAAHIGGVWRSKITLAQWSGKEPYNSV